MPHAQLHYMWLSCDTRTPLARSVRPRARRTLSSLRRRRARARRRKLCAAVLALHRVEVDGRGPRGRCLEEGAVLHGGQARDDGAALVGKYLPRRRLRVSARAARLTRARSDAAVPHALPGRCAPAPARRLAARACPGQAPALPQTGRRRSLAAWCPRTSCKAVHHMRRSGPAQLRPRVQQLGTHRLGIKVGAPGRHDGGRGLAVVVAHGRPREEGYPPVVPVLQHDARGRLRGARGARLGRAPPGAASACPAQPGQEGPAACALSRGGRGSEGPRHGNESPRPLARWLSPPNAGTPRRRAAGRL